MKLPLLIVVITDHKIQSMEIHLPNGTIWIGKDIVLRAIEDGETKEVNFSEFDRSTDN